MIALFVGDEVDGEVNDELRTVLTLTLSLWQLYPSLGTYVGGHVNRMNGVYSGITDYQGMDMYIAACAPHVQNFGHPPPVRGSYDYMRTTRSNHMPLPTWTYSQGVFSGWNSPFAVRDPDASELLLQAASVVAAGSKGIMYFESNVELNAEVPETWQAIKDFNTDIGAIREFLRQGDVINSISTSDGFEFASPSTVAAIRSPSVIVVVAINFNNAGGYNDYLCEIGENIHWIMLDHTISSIAVDLPADFGPVVDVFELLNGQILEFGGVAVTGVDVAFTNFTITAQVAKRVVLLANTLDVRTEVQANLESTGTRN